MRVRCVLTDCCLHSLSLPLKLHPSLEQKPWARFTPFVSALLMKKKKGKRAELSFAVFVRKMISFLLRIDIIILGFVLFFPPPQKVYFHQTLNFPLPLCPGEAGYSCQRTIELIRWIMRSPPWFLSISLPLSFWNLSGQKPGALWKPAMWHLAASAPSRGSKGGPRCTFHGDAENQRNTRLLQPLSRWCQRVRAPTAPASGGAGARVCPQVKAAEPQGSSEQKDFPLDERVQTPRPETRQEGRRSVRHKEQAAFSFVLVLTSS